MREERPSHAQCSCGSGFPFAACCGPFIAGLGRAPDALALMRSRYTAFTLSRTAYLLETWHPSTRPAALDLEPARRWLGLRIVETDAGEPGDVRGTVEFVARSKVGGRAQRLHERSRFVFEDDRWLYVDGERLGPRG